VTFRVDEIQFLRSHEIARLATSGRDGQPDVVPVAVEFDGAHFWVGGSGESVLRTRKVGNVRAGRRVALVVDDLPSFDPFVGRLREPSRRPRLTASPSPRRGTGQRSRPTFRR